MKHPAVPVICPAWFGSPDTPLTAEFVTENGALTIKFIMTVDLDNGARAVQTSTWQFLHEVFAEAMRRPNEPIRDAEHFTLTRRDDGTVTMDIDLDGQANLLVIEVTQQLEAMFNSRG
jgi:hypothetical protein